MACDDEADDAARTERLKDDWPQLSPLDLAICLADGRDRPRVPPAEGEQP
jgi:hypothetical protein